MTRFLRLPEVADRVGLSHSHIYALIAQGKFPIQVKLGPRASAWVEGEIEDWIAARIRQRDYGAHAATQGAF